MNAYNLLEEMYGPQWNDWDETNQFESLDEFVGQRYRMYERHLEEKGLDKEDRELFDRNNDEWIQFSIDLNRDWWYKLDKAFVEYFEYDSGLYNFLTTNNLINE